METNGTINRLPPANRSPLSNGRAAAAVLCCVVLLALSACSAGALPFQNLPEAAQAPAAPEAPAADENPAAQETLTLPSGDGPAAFTKESFEGASLFSQRALNDLDFLVVIQMGAEMEEGSPAGLSVSVNDQPYRCMVLQDFKDRLYCVGTPPEAGKEARLAATSGDAQKPVFSAGFMPELPAAPVEPTTVQVDMAPAGTAFPTATEGPTGGGGEGSGSGVENVQPGGAIGGGKEEMGGGIAPTFTPDPLATPTSAEDLPFTPAVPIVPVSPDALPE